MGTLCNLSSGGVIVAIERDENATNMELKVQLQSVGDGAGGWGVGVQGGSGWPDERAEDCRVLVL